jgi:uncharacterized membrane protein YkvA (DUF1232 family)
MSTEPKNQPLSFAERSKALLQAIKQEITVYQLVMRHPRTPWLARGLLGLAVAYFLSPIDLIPDPIPVLGQLDDLLIVPGLVGLAMKLIPKDVVAECREQVKAQQKAAEPPIA